MPTYVYACKNCGHRFEKYQSFSEDSLVTCPECGQDALRKVFDSVGIVFKGSGFYSTDAKTSGASTGPKPASEGSSDTAGTSTSASDAGSSSSAPSASAPSTSSVSSSGTTSSGSAGGSTGGASTAS